MTSHSTSCRRRRRLGDTSGGALDHDVRVVTQAEGQGVHEDLVVINEQDAHGGWHSPKSGSPVGSAEQTDPCGRGAYVKRVMGLVPTLRTEEPRPAPDQRPATCASGAAGAGWLSAGEPARTRASRAQTSARAAWSLECTPSLVSRFWTWVRRGAPLDPQRARHLLGGLAVHDAAHDLPLPVGEELQRPERVVRRLLRAQRPRWSSAGSTAS